MAKAYTLKKRKETGECHLFEGDFTADGCNTHLTPKSICDKMTIRESLGNVFECQNDERSRRLCAEQGRRVCGICVSHLYTTY